MQSFLADLIKKAAQNGLAPFFLNKVEGIDLTICLSNTGNPLIPSPTWWRRRLSEGAAESHRTDGQTHRETK